MVADLCNGLGAIDPALVEQAARYILAWPALYNLDAILVPALRQLAEGCADFGTPGLARLREAVLAHLRARTAEPLAPPADWRRNAKLPCRCAHCQQLARFLDSPTEKTWAFRATEADRRHVEEAIRKGAADLDTATDRRGRPYTLVCTKNQTSYERRAKQRAQDLKDLALLEA
jgi:hypothetical protein